MIWLFKYYGINNSTDTQSGDDIFNYNITFLDDKMESFELNNNQYVLMEENAIKIQESTQDTHEIVSDNSTTNDIMETNGAWYNFFY